MEIWSNYLYWDERLVEMDVILADDTFFADERIFLKTNILILIQI